MTTSSDSSVTKCETCGEARGATFFKRGHPGVEFHGEGMGHAFVPAPAPSSDPVSDQLVTLLQDARSEIAALRSFIDSAEPLTLADRGRLIALCDRLQNARDERLGFATAPVLSPTEAGPHEHDVPMSAMDGRGHEHRKFIEPPNDESVAEFRARWRTAAFDGIDDRNRAKKFAQLANAEAESAWVSGARWGADWMLAHLREEARRGR